MTMTLNSMSVVGLSQNETLLNNHSGKGVLVSGYSPEIKNKKVEGFNPYQHQFYNNKYNE